MKNLTCCRANFLVFLLVRDVFECVGDTPQVITSLLEHLLPKRMKLLWREHFTCSQHLKVKAEVRGNVAFEGAKRSVLVPHTIHRILTLTNLLLLKLFPFFNLLVSKPSQRIQKLPSSVEVFRQPSQGAP